MKEKPSLHREKKERKGQRRINTSPSYRPASEFQKKRAKKRRYVHDSRKRNERSDCRGPVEDQHGRKDEDDDSHSEQNSIELRDC